MNVDVLRSLVINSGRLNLRNINLLIVQWPWKAKDIHLIEESELHVLCLVVGYGYMLIQN